MISPSIVNFSFKRLFTAIFKQIMVLGLDFVSLSCGALNVYDKKHAQIILLNLIRCKITKLLFFSLFTFIGGSDPFDPS